MKNCCNFQWVLVVVRDVEKESEIESEGSLKKAFFFQKTRFAVAKMAKKCVFCVFCVCRACCACCVRSMRFSKNKSNNLLWFLRILRVFGCFQLFCNHVQLNLFCGTLYFSDFFVHFQVLELLSANVPLKKSQPITRQMRFEALQNLEI